MPHSPSVARRSRPLCSPYTRPDLDLSRGLDDIRVACARKTKTPSPDISEKLFNGYYVLGQYLARCFDPMLPIRESLIYAKVFIIGLEDIEDTYNEQTRRYHTKAWDVITNLFPDVQDELHELSMDEFNSRIQAIKSGMCNVRSTDANRLKTYTGDYALLDTQSEKIVLSTGRSKMDRGFNHPILGRFLLPINLLGDFDENRDEVIDRIKSGECRITALQFPTFLYEEGSYDPDDLLYGLFRGHFLIRCCISIFIGPQVALNTPEQVVISRSCNANRLKILKITPQIIAYTCVQARFALTTCGTWRQQDGGFDYSLFHRKITELFDPEFGYYDDVWVTTTLEWWNKHVFGNKKGNPMLNMSTDIDDEDSNFFARIQAQVVMRKGGATDNGREDTPSTPRPTPARSTPRLTPSRLPSSSFTASLPVTPQHMPSGSAIPSSPVTPQREEGDDEIGFHPKLGRARNIGTDDNAPLVTREKERSRRKSNTGRTRRR